MTDLPALADAAVEVVGDAHDDGHRQERAEQPVDGEGHEGQLEDVEAHVAPELRIGDTEVHAVAQEEPFVPSGRRPSAEQHRRPQRRREPQRARPAVDQDVDGPERALFGDRRAEGGGEAVGDHEVDPHKSEHTRHEHERQADLRPQQLQPDGVEPHRIEPQVVRVQARGAPSGHDRDGGQEHREA